MSNFAENLTDFTSLPETKLVYLENTYLFELEATILDILEENEQKVLILDQTIFYPQGGGQPSDVGSIISKNGKNGQFQVEKCIFNPSGQVWHFGKILEGNLVKGEKVQLKINMEKRLINAKNHTAGHAIDWAVANLSWPIIPLKGFHFPQGPYVEYTGELDLDEQKRLDLEKEVNQIIEQNPQINFLLEEQKHQSGKPMRIMSVANQKDCPCGGTHLKSTLEIGQIKILKLKNNKGNLRISYLVE